MAADRPRILRQRRLINTRLGGGEPAALDEASNGFGRHPNPTVHDQLFMYRRGLLRIERRQLVHSALAGAGVGSDLTDNPLTPVLLDCSLALWRGARCSGVSPLGETPLVSKANGVGLGRFELPTS